MFSRIDRKWVLEFSRYS